MKKIIPIVLCVLCFGLSNSSAEQIFRIEVGSDYNSYSQSDLKRRVWELERAVFQLQQRVFQLETGKETPTPDSWVCTISVFGKTYTGTGGTKAVAKARSIESCQAKGEQGTFCHDPKCEQ